MRPRRVVLFGAGLLSWSAAVFFGCVGQDPAGSDGAGSGADGPDGGSGPLEADASDRDGPRGPLLEIAMIYRDFIALPRPSPKISRHPDFEATFVGGGPTAGLVGEMLGDDDTPTYTGRCEEGAAAKPDCPYGPMTTSESNFRHWYHSDRSANREIQGRLSLEARGDGTYVFESRSFFPLDDQGWAAETLPGEEDGGEPIEQQLPAQELGEPPSGVHNFGFTSVLKHRFRFRGNEAIEFSGDDDVWVFVNRHLVIDLGGTHPETGRRFVLEEPIAARLGMVVGGDYDLAIFHAERHTVASHYRLTLAFGPP